MKARAATLVLVGLATANVALAQQTVPDQVKQRVLEALELASRDRALEERVAELKKVARHRWALWKKSEAERDRRMARLVAYERSKRGVELTRKDLANSSRRIGRARALLAAGTITAKQAQEVIRLYQRRIAAKSKRLGKSEEEALLAAAKKFAADEAAYHAGMQAYRDAQTALNRSRFQQVDHVRAVFGDSSGLDRIAPPYLKAVEVHDQAGRTVYRATWKTSPQEPDSVARLATLLRGMRALQKRLDETGKAGERDLTTIRRKLELQTKRYADAAQAAAGARIASDLAYDLASSWTNVGSLIGTALTRAADALGWTGKDFDMGLTRSIPGFETWYTQERASALLKVVRRIDLQKQALKRGRLRPALAPPSAKSFRVSSLHAPVPNLSWGVRFGEVPIDRIKQAVSQTAGKDFGGIEKELLASGPSRLKLLAKALRSKGFWKAQGKDFALGALKDAAASGVSETILLNAAAAGAALRVEELEAHRELLRRYNVTAQVKESIAKVLKGWTPLRAYEPEREWAHHTRPRRHLNRPVDEVLQAGSYRLALTFSRKVEDLEVFLGPKQLTAPELPSSTFTLKFELSEAETRAKAGLLFLRVKAKAFDATGLALDADASTIPCEPKAETKRLRWSRDHETGFDGRHHRLKLRRLRGVSLTVLMDGSGSMEEGLAITKGSTRGALDAWAEASELPREYSLWTFVDGKIGRSVPFTRDLAPLRKGINALSARGGTPLGAAILRSGSDLLHSGALPHKVLVVVSDGEDTMNGDPAAAMRWLRALAKTMRQELELRRRGH